MKYKLSEYLSDNMGSLLGVGSILTVMFLLTINATIQHGYKDQEAEWYVIIGLTTLYLGCFGTDYFVSRKRFKKENK